MSAREALELLAFWDEIRSEVPAEQAFQIRRRYGISPFRFHTRLRKAAYTPAGQTAYPALTRRLISRAENLRVIRWP